MIFFSENRIKIKKPEPRGKGFLKVFVCRTECLAKEIVQTKTEYEKTESKIDIKLEYPKTIVRFV